MTSDIGNISGRAIVIGAHVMSFEQAEGLPHKSVIYNTEHVTSSWIKREDTLYLQLLRRYEVWDYNQDNSRYLATILGKDVKFVRVGYVSQSTRINSAPVLDIDVLFYGSVNARRQVILNGLRSAGLSVHHAFGVYGRQRDALIARSKVVLNMHYRGGRLRRDSVSVPLSGSSAGWVHPVPLLGPDAGRALARPE